MDAIEQAHQQAIDGLVAQPGRIFVVGDVDCGKTTFALRLVRAAVQAGHVAAIIDADLGQPVIGPPGAVALKIVRTESDLLPDAAPDAMSFVGAVSPRGHFLPLVAGTAMCVMRGIEMGARLIVVDTSGYIGGLAGQTLKLTKAELCRPHHVVALARGGELEPVVGVLQRFLSEHVIELACHPDVTMRSVDERVSYREARLAAFLGPQVYRWRIKPSVFFPTLPPDFELSVLDGLLVGVDDGTGLCVGIGVLEHQEDGLRLLTPVSEGVKAVRLGSTRVTPEGRITGIVDIRSMLGTD